jgi:putative acetyltransferase
MITIRQIKPDAPAVACFIRELDAYQESLYPPESNHLVPLSELSTPKYYFLGAFEKDMLVGIGSFLRTSSDYVEIKRLYVPQSSRKKGIAIIIMAALEESAREAGFLYAKLETGVHQVAAIQLYEKIDYATIKPFGKYTEDPLSVFMEKKLK